MLKITMFGEEFELATTLRVAYTVQGQHNHKSYMEIFSGIDKMTVEEQIKIIYAAFKVKNKDASYTEQQVIDWFLDNCTITEVMSIVEKIITGIVGKAPAEVQTDNKSDEEGKQETPYMAQSVQDSI